MKTAFLVLATFLCVISCGVQSSNDSLKSGKDEKEQSGPTAASITKNITAGGTPVKPTATQNTMVSSGNKQEETTPHTETENVHKTANAPTKEQQSVTEKEKDQSVNNVITPAESESKGKEQRGPEVPQTDDLESTTRSERENGKNPDVILKRNDKEESSHFFVYLVSSALLVAVIYIAYHNKRKIIAFFLEGKKSRSTRRPKSTEYQKLEQHM
ncbi:trans-Golgi network integral membrane protein TGN38 [Pungitius pungitius]|uniref:trans-Golgi network integral membrane protein TGN38 n=1 Tax=Pungitius pungitius TaxID=134920 RepID=UPI002E15255F